MIRYRTLFQVNVSHDFPLSRGDIVFEAQPAADQVILSSQYAVNNFLEIFPDMATLGRLAGSKMIFRMTDSGFRVAVQIDPTAADVRPAIVPGADFSLTFGLRLVDPRFANYTELGPVTTGFYRFGNDSHNEVAGSCFLSRAVAAFDPTRTYVAGETYSLVAGPTFDLFLALQDTGPAATPVAADWRRIPPDTWSATTTYQSGAIVLFGNNLYRALVNGPGTDLTNAADWQPAGTLANQYATVGDAILPVAGLFNLDISSAALPKATIRLFRGAATTPIAQQGFAAEQGTLAQVQLDLRGLAAGIYRIQVLDGSLALVPGLSSSVYLSPSAVTEGWFGVVEIVSSTGDFALFNPDGTLRAPTYTLRFLNRSTRWRYIFPAVQTVGTGAEVAPEAGDGSILVTGSPRPLTQFGFGSRLQTDDPATTTVSEEVLLPAPDVNLVRRKNGTWYSEVRVPNITLGP